MVQTQKSVKGMGVYQCLDEGISWISCPKTKFLYVRCKWLEENKDKKVEYSLQKVLYPFFFFLTLSCDIAQKMPKKMLISPITKNMLGNGRAMSIYYISLNVLESFTSLWSRSLLGLAIRVHGSSSGQPDWPDYINVSTRTRPDY
jgi:hypothetical protein